MAAAAVGSTGCAPQLDRIELGVQENHDEIARLQAENRRLMQEVQALGQLLRMDQDAGDESSAMRLAKLAQVSVRLDQLLQKLDDNAEYMRDLSARVDLLATRSGIPTLGEYKPPVAGAHGRDPARGGPGHPRGRGTGSQPGQHRPGPVRVRGVPGALSAFRGGRRRALLAGRPGLRRRPARRGPGPLQRADRRLPRQRTAAGGPVQGADVPAGTRSHGRGLGHGQPPACGVSPVGRGGPAEGRARRRLTARRQQGEPRWRSIPC